MSAFSKTAYAFEKGYGIKMLLWKQKEKHIVMLLLLCVLCIEVLLGCGGRTEEAPDNNAVGTTESTAPETEEILLKRFGGDSLMARATSADNAPYVRTADKDGAFYVLPHTL